MIKKRHILKINDGITKLGGIDVGEYPIHHFEYNRFSEGQMGWPIKLISTGDDEWIRGCYRYRNNSTIFALEFVQEGDFLFVQNGRKNIVRPGEVFIVQLGSNTEMSVYKSEYAVKKTIELSGSALEAILQSTGLNKFDLVRPLNTEWLREKFDEEYNLCKKNAPDFMLKCSAIAYEILLDLGRSVSHSEYPIKLQRVLTCLEHNIGNNLSLADICRNCSVSSATLHRLFIKYLQVSPMEYFIAMKIDTAKNLLIAGSYFSIKEIAAKVGYSNQLYFSTEFKKRVGVSPRAYRLTPKTPIA